ncbi:hypothetical protein [Dyadobacter sp. MSC1_007]|jgi:hypothetical protein|uniref:hypothetical protein n=1 Tax=Dyadobacter sp. MSC1_007 TaxID=2909264 RepID=UPI00202F1DDA|nr:hypothetical protein [Dyadobacter sp. MSC1_007]
MKTSEDNLNEALRAVLKRKFDDYEALPDPSAYAKIRARLKPVRRWRYFWLSWPALILGIIAIGTKEYLDARKDGKGISQINQRAVEIKTERLSRATVLAPRSGTTKATSVEKTFPKPLVATVAVNQKTNSFDNAKKYAVVNARTDEKAPAAQLPTKIRELSALPGERLAAVNGYDKVPPASDTEEDFTDDAGREVPLEPLDHIIFEELDVNIVQRTVSTPPKPELKREITVNPSKITWLANAAVLHTYQILTVPSSAARDFQNFSFPSVFALKSMGYKLSAGIEKKGLQLQLHYSGFRQTYSYEVANDSYLVKPDENGNYKTYRQGDRINEDTKYSLLGIGINKTMRWGRSPYSRFYATAGLEYSYALTGNKSLGWLNLGIGKQIAVTRKSALHIGPYAEFSPMKISGIGNPFFYQPYRVGISMGLRFVRP